MSKDYKVFIHPKEPQEVDNMSTVEKTGHLAHLLEIARQNTAESQAF